MGKIGAWWDARYCAVLLFMIEIVSSWTIGLRVNYSKAEISPLVQLTLDQDCGKRPYESRQLIKTYRLKLFKELPSNITEEDGSADTNKNKEEVLVPISFASDADSHGDEIPSSLTTTVLNASDETHNLYEKLPEDSQFLLAAADGEQEAAIFGTIFGQLARPLDQLLGGQISSMVLALNQTASSSSSSSQQGGGGNSQEGGQQSGGSSGGSQSGGGQSGQQGSSGGSQNGGQQNGQHGGGGETQGGGGGRENEEQENGGQQGGQGGGGGGQGGGGQVQCVPNRGLCTVFSARQCCPGTTCSVFPLGLLGSISGPLSGPIGSLALGSCQPVVG